MGRSRPLSEAPRVSDLDHLVGGLRRQGQADSSGQFTVDADRLLSKLTTFQLPPGHFQLCLVRAASLSGAHKLSIQVTSSKIHCRFDGDPVSAEQCQKLAEALFHPESDARLHQLALALFQGVREVGPARLQGLTFQRDTFRCQGSYQKGPCELIWRTPRGSWLGALLAFLPGGESFNVVRLKRLLTDRCAFGPLEILLNGQPLMGRPLLPSAGSPVYQWGAGQQTHLQGGPEVLLALSAVAESGSAVFIVHGVATPAHLLPQVPGLSIRVYTDRLRLDYSQSQVVENSAYDSLVKWIEEYWLLALQHLRQEPDVASQRLCGRLLQLVGSQTGSVGERARSILNPMPLQFPGGHRRHDPPSDCVQMVSALLKGVQPLRIDLSSAVWMESGFRLATTSGVLFQRGNLLEVPRSNGQIQVIQMDRLTGLEVKKKTQVSSDGLYEVSLYLFDLRLASQHLLLADWSWRWLSTPAADPLEEPWQRLSQHLENFKVA